MSAHAASKYYNIPIYIRFELLTITDIIKKFREEILHENGNRQQRYTKQNYAIYRSGRKHSQAI